jgi:hypothetical protein
LEGGAAGRVACDVYSRLGGVGVVYGHLSFVWGPESRSTSLRAGRLRTWFGMTTRDGWFDPPSRPKDTRLPGKEGEKALSAV